MTHFDGFNPESNSRGRSVRCPFDSKDSGAVLPEIRTRHARDGGLPPLRRFGCAAESGSADSAGCRRVGQPQISAPKSRPRESAEKSDDAPLMPATMLSAALLMLLLWTGRAEKRTYMTYDLPSICAQHSSFRIRMHHSGTGSTGLLKAQGLLSTREERECVALIRPPRGYGVVISLRAPLRLRRDDDGCRDYVKIHNETTPSNASTPLCGECCEYAPASCEPGCGYGAALRACSAFCGSGTPEPLSGDGALVVHYHTRCGACADEELGFQMVFTAYRVVPAQEAPCVWPSDFECANGRCIWSGLTCDGHDNCGDESDEDRAGNAHCAGEFPDPVKAAVVASAVIVTVLLGVLLAYFPRMKLRSWLGLRAARGKKPDEAKRPERRSVSFQNPLPKIRENSLSESEV